MITSTKNPAVSSVKSLLLKSSERKEQGLFVAEGKRLCQDIIKSGWPIKKAYVTEDFIVKEKDFFSNNIYEIVSPNVLKAMGDTKTPQGVIGIFELPKFSSKDIFSVENPLVLILDGISDPGNMGTMIRGFEACGGNGIILVNNCTDPFGAKCIRSTMGSIVRLPVIKAESAKDLKELLDKNVPDLKIYACHMEGMDYEKVDFKKPTALIIGNEARGLSSDMVTLSNNLIRIPMEGRVESLNAAVTALVVGFEAARQRRIG